MKSGVYGKLDLQVHQKLKSKNLAEEYSNGVEEYVTFKEEKTSSANLTDDKLKKEVENYLYKNVQSVIGEPALILAESDKQIDNLVQALKYGRNDTFPRTGLKLAGKLTFYAEQKFMSIPDYKLTKKSKKFTLITRQVAKRFNITEEKASEIVKGYYDFSNIADYSSFRVMHGVIENTLSCLTGLSKHELDEKRCTDLEGLAKKVKAALNNNCDLEMYVKDQGIQSSKLKRDLVQHMQSVINVLKENKGSDLFTKLVRNWNQDKKLHILMPPKELRDIPAKLVNLLGENHHAIVRDYLECYGVEESKIDELCQLGKEVCANRKKSKDNLPLEENGKKLFEELGKALEMTLQNRDNLTYEHLDNLTTSGFTYNSQYQYNQGKYPLETLRNFCNENKYKVKLKSSDDLSAANLKSKLFDYISCQSLEQLEKQLHSLRTQLPDDLSFGKQTDMDSCEMIVELFSNDKEGIGSRMRQLAKSLSQKELAKVIDYLSEDTLRSFYQNLLEEENDYHALCRMGMVGNDINPTKVQGYNDINLQHVGMLIDPTSTDLNKPAQLIQAPGRLRCLNSNRHSTFFCYSSGKLSFDINQLKKGDYIDVYNESAAKLSNQQAYGDKLAAEVINYINQEIKSLKRIDDLTGQSINIALSSFIEVYNTNQHDFNKSKKEFIGVLKHARRKLTNYEKELRGSGSTFGMKMFKVLIKAIVMVGYLFLCFAHYLATKDNYNSFLKKVNELKDDPNVVTYARIIAKYSIKNVEEIRLLYEKFCKIYEQREKPQNETDTKSFNNYLEHINACLKHPVYLKLFDKVTSPLMKGDYLLKLLNQLFPEEDNQDKVGKLRTFRKNLKDKSFKFTKDDLSNVEQIQLYLQGIFSRIKELNNYYYNQECNDISIIPSELSQYGIDGMCTEGSKKSNKYKERYLDFQNYRAILACLSDLNELKILSKREEIKLAKEVADYVISPLLGDSSYAAKNKQASEEDRKVLKSVITMAGQVKNDLEKEVKPFTAKDILSPNTEFVNPIVRLFQEKGTLAK
ncbi:MAG: hypothetical protein ACEY3K_00040 [Wolbachia sp.]